MQFWYNTVLKEYEEENGINAFLIHPDCIPEGHNQTWDENLKQYVLVPIDSAKWVERTPHSCGVFACAGYAILPPYQRNEYTMDEETTVEAPVEAENAPESVPEAEVEETVEDAADEPVEAESA